MVPLAGSKKPSYDPAGAVGLADGCISREERGRQRAGDLPGAHMRGGRVGWGVATLHREPSFGSNCGYSLQGEVERRWKS